MCQQQQCWQQDLQKNGMRNRGMDGDDMNRGKTKIMEVMEEEMMRKRGKETTRNPQQKALLSSIPGFDQVMSNVLIFTKLFVIMPLSTLNFALSKTMSYQYPSPFSLFFSPALCPNGCPPAVPTLWYKETPEQMSAATRSGDRVALHLPLCG